MLNQNKKARMMMEFILAFAFAIVGFFIVLGAFGKIASKADIATAEQLCRNFNAARTRTNIDLAVTEFNLVPRVCKMIDKNIPSNDYENTAEGTMSEMAYSVARCWWQWLEGTEPNIFEDKWPWEKNKCFVCYSFKIKKGIEQFDSARFKKFLSDTQYIVKDTSDKCNVNDGGWCRIKCLDDEKQIPSSRCEEEEVGGELKQTVCCNKNIECLNKGGICSNTCGADYKEYEGWSCKGSEGEKCCIKRDDFLSYTDYVQRYMGEGTIIIKDIDKFVPLEETYAITFYSKTNNWLIDLFRDQSVIDSIRISKLNEVKNVCSVEADIGGT